jgi:hypothetical protein
MTPFLPTPQVAWRTVAPDLPQIDLQRVRQWCQQRTPAHVRHQLRLEHTTRGREITVVERRVPWDAPDTEFGPQWTSRPIARLRHSAEGWRLYWPETATSAGTSSRTYPPRPASHPCCKPSTTPTAHSSDNTQPPAGKRPANYR